MERRGRKRSVSTRVATIAAKHARQERAAAAQSTANEGRQVARGRQATRGRGRAATAVRPRRTPALPAGIDLVPPSQEKDGVPANNSQAAQVLDEVSSTPQGPISQAAPQVEFLDFVQQTPNTSSGELNVVARSNPNPFASFAESLQETLRLVRDAALSDTDSRVSSRVQMSRDLPVFSGNPLEWMHFEETYKSSTRLCQFTDRENITRLFKALRGPARDAVETLLCTATSAEQVMQLLRLNYGNKRHVADRILKDVYDLPSLQSGKIDIARFATRLKTAITSLKSLNMPEYLNSIDLLRSVAGKLTEEKKSSFNRYKPSDPNLSCLEKLSEFLYGEAELAIGGGLLNLELAPLYVKDSARDKIVPRRGAHNAATIFVASTGSPDVSARNDDDDKNASCAACQRSNHDISECSVFKKESFKRKRVIVAKAGLCFKCLGRNHIARRCTRAIECDVCRKPHHTAMHITKRAPQNDRPRGLDPRSDEHARETESGRIETSHE